MARPVRLFAPNISPALNAVGATNANGTNQYVANMFTNDALVDHVLSRVDYFLLVSPAAAQATLATSLNYNATWTAMMQRLQVALARNPHVKFILDVGGTLGYDPAVGPALGYGVDSGVTGRSTPTVQGEYCAEYQILNNIQPLIDLGFDIYALEFQSSYHRLVTNGDLAATSPHQFYRGTGTGNGRITWTVATGIVGTAGSDCRVTYVVAGNNTALSYSVSVHDVTVNLATDGSGVATSTAAQVVSSATAPVLAVMVPTLTASNSGASVLSAMGWVSFYYGDDGVSYTPTEVGTAFGAYMAYARSALNKPKLRFVDNSSFILRPWDGLAGYDGGAYPAAQMPDEPTAFSQFHNAIDAVMTPLGQEGIWAIANDWTYEFANRDISSANSGVRTANQWHDIGFRVHQSAAARATAATPPEGILVFPSMNSSWGHWTFFDEPDGAYDYLNVGEAQGEPLDAKFQAQILLNAAAQRARQESTWSALAPMLDGAQSLYTWFEYPKVLIDNEVSTSTAVVANSFSATYFKAVAAQQPRRITVSIGNRRFR